jgi:hypothetical protein
VSEPADDPREAEAVFEPVVEPREAEAVFEPVDEPREEEAVFAPVVEPREEEAVFAQVAEPREEEAVFVSVAEPQEEAEGSATPEDDADFDDKIIRLELPSTQEILWMGPSGEPAAETEPETGIWLDAASEGDAQDTITWLETPNEPLDKEADAIIVPMLLETDAPMEKLTFIPGGLEETASSTGLPPFLRSVVEEENDEELLDFFRRRREN